MGVLLTFLPTTDSPESEGVIWMSGSGLFRSLGTTHSGYTTGFLESKGVIHRVTTSKMGDKESFISFHPSPNHTTTLLGALESFTGLKTVLLGNPRGRASRPTIDFLEDEGVLRQPHFYCFPGTEILYTPALPPPSPIVNVSIADILTTLPEVRGGTAFHPRLYSVPWDHLSVQRLAVPETLWSHSFYQRFTRKQKCREPSGL